MNQNDTFDSLEAVAEAFQLTRRELDGWIAAGMPGGPKRWESSPIVRWAFSVGPWRSEACRNALLKDVVGVSSDGARADVVLEAHFGFRRLWDRTVDVLGKVRAAEYGQFDAADAGTIEATEQELAEAFADAADEIGGGFLPDYATEEEMPPLAHRFVEVQCEKEGRDLARRVDRFESQDEKLSRIEQSTEAIYGTLAQFFTEWKAPRDFKTDTEENGEEPSAYLGIVLGDMSATREGFPHAVKFGRKRQPWRLFKLLVEAGDGMHKNELIKNLGLEDKTEDALRGHKTTVNDLVMKTLRVEVEADGKGVWKIISLP